MSSASYKHWVLNKAGVRKIHICAISDRNGNVAGIGHAICSPEDEYNAERGREIAQGRALKEYRSRPKTEEEVLDDVEKMFTPSFKETFDERIDRAMDQAIEEIYAFPAVLGGPDRLS